MKHSETRNRIIETASALFYKNGYNSTGINEIIAESGIAKATLYNHFKSKDDICVAYLNFKNNSFNKNITSFVEQYPSGEKQILAIFDFLKSFYQGKYFNGCWCIKTVAEISMDNEKIRRVLQNQKEELITFIEKLVQENLQIKTSKKLISTAKKIYLMYESAVVESHLHQEDWPIKEAKEICSQIIS